MWWCKQSGFTLIELVMVIVILGVLTVSAIGLFATKDSYTPILIKNQVLSSARLAQQAALARDGGTNPVLLQMTQPADYQFSVVQGGTTLSQLRADAQGATLKVSTSSFGGSCAALAGGLSTISFGRNGTTGMNTRICVVGATEFELCISPSGYAYDGLCVP